MVQISTMVVLKCVTMEYGALSPVMGGRSLIRGLSVCSLDSPGDVSILVLIIILHCMCLYVISFIERENWIFN